MATMVKEKRREKKKSKEKLRARTSTEISLYVSETLAEENIASTSTLTIEETCVSDDSKNEEILCPEVQGLAQDETPEKPSLPTNEISSDPQVSQINPPKVLNIESSSISYSELIKKQDTVATPVDNATDNYKYLNARLERIAIPHSVDSVVPVSEARELELSNSNAYLTSSTQTMLESKHVNEQPVENVVPSAPMFEEEAVLPIPYQSEIVKQEKPKLQCMPLEEAVKLYEGAEIAAVKVMSEREEAIVEAGPVSGPEHPLVDLLSTFKSSLRAVENERLKLACGFADEEKSRSALWKIEKRNIYLKKECKCGTGVELRAVYEHAELLKERWPVARLKLESLLRDVQDSYCHHQHAALLTHCQIEDLISETIQSNKNEIREALSLVLLALRVSDGAAAVLSAALRRWAAALTAALVDQRDVTHLLFVLHHLFRQSRSVRWAARVLRPRVTDVVSAARTLALLDTLLASPRLDTAIECTEAVFGEVERQQTFMFHSSVWHCNHYGLVLYLPSVAEMSVEDADSSWEEVSARGGGGAVSEGALREIDLLALLRVFPLRDLVARTLLFTHADIRHVRPDEWGDASGGRGVLRACCGVRVLLAVLQRAAGTHAHYGRLRDKLRRLAAAALVALACLHRSPRAPYTKDMEEKIAAELEACFTAGFELCGTHDLHQLTTALLTDHAVKDYCLTIILGLHDKTPKPIESLGIDAPVLPCETRVRLVTYAAVHRETDLELGRIILEFLLQTGGKLKNPSCGGGCAAAARRCVPRLLAAQPRLRRAALHAVAALAQVESLDPSVVDMLHAHEWRPQCEEMQAVLDDWARHCPQLLYPLLLQLDYTPFTGLPLPVQQLIGGWLCVRARTQPAGAEQCWRVLRRLRTHRACWRAPPDAPAPDPAPDDLFSNAYAVLATSWGHSIPLICSSGVEALLSLAPRPRDLAHCLAPVMLLMAHSPESISLTPKFTEVVTALLNSGPTLVQRALGRGGVSGAELLLRLVLRQVEDEKRERGGARALVAWLHALWRVPGAAAVVDTAALASRDWPALDAHAALLLQEENAKEHLNNAVRNASTAPLLCECLLRTQHTVRELNTRMFGAVCDAVWDQRVSGQRVHVDNALQKLKANMTAEELVIHRSAAAALAAPAQHPAHLTLWRLFFHLYLQRPPRNMRETALPVGPLFFSGLVKTRTLSQIKKRLQETATYHQNEAETYKSVSSTESSQEPANRVVKSESLTIKKGLLPALSIKDLTGESSDSSDCDSDDSSDESEEESKVEERKIDSDTSEVEKRNISNMACYHTAAERMLRDFCTWLDEGERVRASPHHADIARFIPEQALEAAWKKTLSRSRPPPSPDLDEFPCPAFPPDAAQEPPKTPLDLAVKSIMRIKDRSGTVSHRLIRSPLEDVDFKNTRSLLVVVDRHLKDIDKMAKEWCSEVSRVSSLDSRLWELVAVLRVPRPLPPVTRQCHNTKATTRCKPVVFYINEREWCISTGAEREINENRSSSRGGVRRLARARPAAARTAAALHSIARRARDSGAAVCVVERAWRAAAVCAPCPAAHTALTTLLTELAERWICHDGPLVAELLSRWGARQTTSLQQTLCGALVAPRRVHVEHWPLVYTALLNAKLPSHTVFSYLSKFEMSHWSKSATAANRRALLDSLVGAHTRHGAAPAPAHCILLELVGVHTTALVSERELCAVVMEFARFAADGKLPPQQWTHMVKAAELVGGRVPFDQLGHLLRDLGAFWWHVRGLYHGAATLIPHAAHVAALQSCLLRAFVAAAVQLSYEPERVGQCAWSALQESWGAWVTPHPTTPPLLPSLDTAEGHYTTMLQCFVDCVLQAMADCPGGSEVPVLQLSFCWAARAHGAAQGCGARQEARVQGSELLVELARLPWTAHQWLHGACLPLAAQICATNDKEIMSWCCDAWGATDAATLLRDVTDDTLAPHLASLLYLFTGAPLRHHQHILDEATRLPWWRLPEPALGDALDRFFAVHHNPLEAYHDLPQFQVLLFASELCVHRADARRGAASRDKRVLALSQWARAAAAPPLHAHVATHTQRVLQTLTDLAPHLDPGSDELAALLGRASVIMCMEPAAAVALPVWLQWVESACAVLRRACVCAASALTAAHYCGALADAALRTQLMQNECEWRSAAGAWSAASAWREPHVFVSRACLHAAYVCALAHTRAAHARPVLAALQTASINFLDNEVIVAVWICYVCRVARECATCSECAAEETRYAARALLTAWAQPPRRSLLHVVTLQADTARPTTFHQVLCRLAECILAPSAQAAQAYEAACMAAPGSLGAALPWGRSAEPARLPRLAARLYPKHDRYFTYELEAVPDTS